VRDELRWIKEVEPHRLAISPRPRGGPWLAGDMSAWRMRGVDAVISLIDATEEGDFELEHEAVLCRSAGMEFVSFPIPDRGVPSSPDAVESLVDWVISDLRRGLGVAIHCRFGIGRSGLMAACVLHKLGHAQDTLFPILSRARGVTVPDTDAQVQWVRRFASTATPMIVRS
jgi:protein-tyrosine phosphatase